MNLYILRHASAGLRRPNPLLDSKRPLDKEGKKHCLQLAQVLNALNIQFDLIVSSPLKRCLQTASLVGTETGYESKILLSNGHLGRVSSRVTRLPVGCGRPLPRVQVCPVRTS